MAYDSLLSMSPAMSMRAGMAVSSTHRLERARPSRYTYITPFSLGLKGGKFNRLLYWRKSYNLKNKHTRFGLASLLDLLFARLKVA